MGTHNKPPPEIVAGREAAPWAHEGLEPTRPARQRLRFAHDLLNEIEGAQGKKSARAWCISVNPRLEYQSPINAIRQDRFQETTAAAKAQIDDAYDG